MVVFESLIILAIEKLLTGTDETTESVTNIAKTYRIEDSQGRAFELEPDQLIQAAQACIRERFDFEKPEITSADSAREQIQVLIGHYQHEVFMALWLNTKHRLINHEVMFRGTINSSAVYPREVVKAAISHNAAAVIFAHNHPSGSSEPSPSDQSITQRLKEALALIDVRVVDHFVVGEQVNSMAEQGLI